MGNADTMTMSPVDIDAEYDDSGRLHPLEASRDRWIVRIARAIALLSIIPFFLGIETLGDAMAMANDPHGGLAVVMISMVAMAFVTVSIAMLICSAYLRSYEVS